MTKYFLCTFHILKKQNTCSSQECIHRCFCLFRFFTAVLVPSRTVMDVWCCWTRTGIQCGNISNDRMGVIPLWRYTSQLSCIHRSADCTFLLVGLTSYLSLCSTDTSVTQSSKSEILPNNGWWWLMMDDFLYAWLQSQLLGKFFMTALTESLASRGSCFLFAWRFQKRAPIYTMHTLKLHCFFCVGDVYKAFSSFSYDENSFIIPLPTQSCSTDHTL